jgi:hypothetical protein
MKIDNLGINQFRLWTKGLSQAVVDVKVHKILFHGNFVVLILSFIEENKLEWLIICKTSLSNPL